MSKGIVGFKITIEYMQGKAKLSQNHSSERRDLVIQQLENSLDAANRQIAHLMKKH